MLWVGAQSADGIFICLSPPADWFLADEIDPPVVTELLKTAALSAILVSSSWKAIIVTGFTDQPSN